MVRHHRGALMVPATTTLSWWDCINPYCESNAQPADDEIGGHDAS